MVLVSTGKLGLRVQSLQFRTSGRRDSVGLDFPTNFHIQLRNARSGFVMGSTLGLIATRK